MRMGIGRAPDRGRTPGWPDANGWPGCGLQQYRSAARAAPMRRYRSDAACHACILVLPAPPAGGTCVAEGNIDGAGGAQLLGMLRIAARFAPQCNTGWRLNEDCKTWTNSSGASVLYSLLCRGTSGIGAPLVTVTTGCCMAMASEGICLNATRDVYWRHYRIGMLQMGLSGTVPVTTTCGLANACTCGEGLRPRCRTEPAGGNARNQVRQR